MSTTVPSTVAKVSLVSTTVPSTVAKAKFRRRHVGLVMSFLAFVVVPTALAIYYLFSVADDQFSSRVSFSIRSEEGVTPLEALSGLGQLATGSSSDASILYEYLRSQKLVEDISEQLNIREIYSKPSFDPVFAFNPENVLEELVLYFERMNYITFDANNGLLDVESFAFTAEDAEAVSTAIFAAGSALVERLSKVAQEDTTKEAKIELQLTRERLVEARKVISLVRGREQTVNPLADLESQMGVLTALQNRLADALVEYDLLLGVSQDTDPRLIALNNRIEAIQYRIQEERNKVGKSTQDGAKSLATVVGEFEALMVDREFAERAYQAANVAYEAALSEARRKSKYLVDHIPPTRAQSSQYPNRPLWALSFFGMCFLIWTIFMLTIYAMLDRR